MFVCQQKVNLYAFYSQLSSILVLQTYAEPPKLMTQHIAGVKLVGQTLVT